MMQLVHKTGGTYNEVNRSIKILEAEGIVLNSYRKQVRCSKVRVISLNKENPRTQKLLHILRELEEDTKTGAPP